MEYAKAKQIKTLGGDTVEEVLATKADASSVPTKVTDLSDAGDYAKTSSVTSALENKQDKLPADSLGLINKALGNTRFLREDGSWQEVQGGGGTGDVEEAPIDGKQYARKNAAWEEVVASGGGGVQPLDGEYFLEVLAMSKDIGIDMVDYPLVAALPYGSYNLEKEPALPDMVVGTGKLTILEYMGQKTIRYLIQADSPADGPGSLRLASGIRLINSSGIETEGYRRDIRSS